jgi:sodium transport system permease protein
LLLIILPLMILPMLPAAELDLGTSLIPVTGMVMLLRALMEAQYREAMTHAVPIIAVTLTCCFFAIRWAIDQFRNETVLFRESERWGLGLWLRHLMRDRGETPSFAEAVMCGVIILLARFFLALAVKIEPTFADFATSTLVIQIALIATPALLMAVVLTRSPPRTLLLKQFPRPLALPAAVLAALALHPVFSLMHRGIAYLYPISQDARAALEPLSQALNSAPLLAAILVVALSPAICEELAFRGFILSGLRHMGHKWLAILLSSFFFGIAHVLLQQSLAAFVVGIVIGYIAVQTGSLLPGILFHFTHNALSILLTRVDQVVLDTYRWLGWLFTLHGAEGSPADQLSLEYNWTVVLGGAVVALGVLWWFRGLPYQQYAEETLKQALDHESKQLVANT